MELGWSVRVGTGRERGGAVPVVVLDVLLEHCLQVTVTEDDGPVEALVADGPMKRSANAFALGARTGVRITRIC
jgi:hypothetical protein